MSGFPVLVVPVLRVRVVSAFPVLVVSAFPVLVVSALPVQAGVPQGSVLDPVL